MVHGPLEARSTMDHPVAQTGGHRSLASNRSRAQKLTGEGRARRGEDGEASAALTQAREKV
jgi:hypothetical protein